MHNHLFVKYLNVSFGMEEEKGKGRISKIIFDKPENNL